MITRGDNISDLAVIPGSPADKANLRENDIILSVNDKEVNADNSLAKLIQQFSPGDEIKLKIWRQGEEKEVMVKLEEYKE